jgi:hypothetical protein
MLTWSATFGGGRTQKAFRTYVSAVDGLDTFDRTAVTEGFGTSDNDIEWLNGTPDDPYPATDYHTDGSQAHMILTNESERHRQVLDIQLTDSFQRATVIAPAIADGPAYEAAIVARDTDEHSYYYGGISFKSDSVVEIFISKRVEDVETDLIVFDTDYTYTAGSSWEIRMYVVGATIQVKAWPTDGEEKTFAYSITATDTSLKAPGRVGLSAVRYDGNGNDDLDIVWDSYTVTDPNHANIVDTGWISSTDASYTYPANVLQNNSYYDMVLVIQDTGGLQATTTSGIKTVWTHPGIGDISPIVDDYKVRLQWTNANIDMSFVNWRVYRRFQVPALLDLDDLDTANSWELLYETSDATGPYVYDDYLTPLNKDVDYIVVQTADRFGSLIESEIADWSTVRMPSDRYFFVPTIPIGTIASYEAGNVTDDSWSDEIEQETLHILNRGRQVQVGDDLGATGTLTIQLRGAGARADREFIQRLARGNVTVWMKNPFGDVKLVKFQTVGVKFVAGVGQTEMSDLSVPYLEVITPARILRKL